MSSFLQSERWEAFQRASGRTTARIDGQLAIRSSTPVGSYWYVPRPTRFDGSVFVDHARTDQAVFVRVDPSDESSIINHELPIRPVAPTQPQDSLVLSLSSSSDELMASFHEKTRYNIRLAEKRGVTVEESTDEAAISDFLTLAQGTAGRQRFRYHVGDYYRTMQATLGGSQLTTDNSQLTTSILVARHNQRPVAAIIVLFDPESAAAYYLHGASSYADRSLMAPHLLQWTAVQAAKARGFRFYDFWGIAPPKAEPSGNYQFDENHPWAGVTRFKLGFGGELTHAPDSFDLVLQPAAYTVYTMGRRLRRSLPF